MIRMGRKYLITGGTGILGYALCDYLLNKNCEVVVLSRDKNKLDKLAKKYPQIDVVSGDVCDLNIIKKCMGDVSGVFHLAALAQVIFAEDGVTESINTNLYGTLNVLNESLNLKNQIDFVLGVSSDKVVQVSGVYGATKFLMEKLFLEYEKKNNNINYRIVRCGNIFYSVDSVLQKWKSKIQNGQSITVTDRNATRFFMTLDDSVDLIFNCLKLAKSSLPYYYEMKSICIGDLLDVMCSKYKPDGGEVDVIEIGLQQGENLHEKLFINGKTSNETKRYTLDELNNIL